MRMGIQPPHSRSRGGVLTMKLECQVLVPKSGKGYYLYIPLIEKRVFLEPLEIKYLDNIIKANEESKKSDTKN